MVWLTGQPECSREQGPAAWLAGLNFKSLVRPRVIFLFKTSLEEKLSLVALALCCLFM